MMKLLDLEGLLRSVSNSMEEEKEAVKIISRK